MQGHPDITVLVMNNLHRHLVAEYHHIDKNHFMILKLTLYATNIFVPHFVGQDLNMGMIPRFYRHVHHARPCCVLRPERFH